MTLQFLKDRNVSHVANVVRKTVFSGDYMSHLTEQFFAETGDKAMYRMKSSDYYTLRYVKWLEAKVENGSSHNKQSTPCSKCGTDRVLMCPNRKCDASPF